MSRPIELKGVIHGRTITLDEDTIFPDGYRLTLHAILEPGESLRLSCGSWAKLPPELVADYEQFMTEELGRPYKMPEVGGQ